MHPIDQIERSAEREEEALEQAYMSGHITLEEYNKEMREIQREARYAYQESYEQEQEALRNEYFGW